MRKTIIVWAAIGAFVLIATSQTSKRKPEATEFDKRKAFVDMQRNINKGYGGGGGPEIDHRIKNLNNY
jgi:hypothetical protein